jgi:myo-inositol 2-dehydrogenase/D-chiro-inositol 1-dehydrogenase
MASAPWARVQQSGIGIGVIGCGSIAYWVHLRIAQQMRGARLVAAADPSPEARARAERLARIPVHEHTEDLLARADVNAVIVSGPTHRHADLVIAACNAGKHVYVEKPLATSTADGARVVAAASAAGVTVMVGFNRRFHPLFEQTRALMREGRVGRIRAAQSTFCELVQPDAMPEWKRRRATGGGVLLDLGSHHIDLMRWFLGDEVARVTASIESDRSEHDSVRLELTMRGGAQVQSWFSFRTATSDWLEFAGESATLRADRHRAGVSLRVPRRFGYGMRSARVAPTPDVAEWWMKRLARPSNEPSYRRALAAFIGALRGESVAVPTLDDGMRALEVVEAAEESARIGTPVDVKTISVPQFHQKLQAN